MKRILIALLFLLTSCDTVEPDYYTPGSIEGTRWTKELPFRSFMMFHKNTIAFGYEVGQMPYFSYYEYSPATEILTTVEEGCYDSNGFFEGTYRVALGEHTLDVQLIEDGCTPRAEAFPGRWLALTQDSVWVVQ